VAAHADRHRCAEHDPRRAGWPTAAAGDHGRCRACGAGARRRTASGRFLIDDEVLAETGVTDLSGYAIDPSLPLLPDLFLD
jgi:hypothetical protein